MKRAIGAARELVALPDGSCGSCIACVTKSGAPCTRGRRPELARFAAKPALGRAIGGRELPGMVTPRDVAQAARNVGERPVVRETEPLDFEPCRAPWCIRRELHPIHGRRGRQR